jgi:hypothetical protein
MGSWAADTIMGASAISIMMSPSIKIFDLKFMKNTSAIINFIHLNQAQDAFHTQEQLTITYVIISTHFQSATPLFKFFLNDWCKQ